jgi:hypothetical protein
MNTEEEDIDLAICLMKMGHTHRASKSSPARPDLSINQATNPKKLARLK